MPKFSSGAQAESLASLQGSELLANGCVNLIGLDAIRDRAGDLWPRKRELVWDFTEKRLQERLAPHDLMLRVDDTTFLIAIVADYATAAQAVCVRVLEEVLLHFIGHLDRADIRLQRVTTIDGTDIAASEVDLARVPRLEDVACRAADISPTPQREREKNPVLFRSVSERSLRIDFAPSPVTSLRHGVLTALHLSRTVVDEETGHTLSLEELDGLTDADLIRIDAATMDYAGLFTTGEHEAGYIALIVPVSYRTLLNRRGRAALIEAGAGSHAMRTGGLFEIVDMDTGTPASRLTEAVALARPMSRGVLGRLPERPGSLASFTGVGFAGLTVPLSRQAARGLDAMKIVRTKGDELKRAFRAVIALDPDALEYDRLGELGFTHASAAVDLAKSVRASPDPSPLPVL